METNWKHFVEKSFTRIAQHSAENAYFHKISVLKYLQNYSILCSGYDKMIKQITLSGMFLIMWSVVLLSFHVGSSFFYLSLYTGLTYSCLVISGSVSE